MSVSDAFIVGEGWISDHYFTTDAASQSFLSKVIERRKAWDAEAAEQRPTPRSRFTEARQRLEVDLASLGELTDAEAGHNLGPQAAAEAAASIHDGLIEVLGIQGHGLHFDRTGPVVRVSSPGITERPPLALILAAPVATIEELLAKDGKTLSESVVLPDDKDEIWSAARLVSLLFGDDDAPDLVLVLAGRWALLAENERWAEGRYLAIDVQLVCERNETKRGGEVDRLLTCLSAESIAPNADGGLWWHGVLEESVKHTVGVSQDLRDGVRLSIELIANEVVDRRRAKGLDPLPSDQAQPLAKQSLRFLYRILFLLYAEASPELGVLPVGAQEYDQGYSLDRLRELVQVKLATPQGRSGTHLYDSLAVLFRLVDAGHAPPRGVSDGDDDGSAFDEGLKFNALRADLFLAKATAHIDEVGLGNAAIQEVLIHLLLSKERSGRDRGFISYAELGINQLGAVYEGLMSYTGFFAETDLYEVAKGGDSSKGSWVVPVDRAEGIAAADFVRQPDKVTGEPRPVLHPKGSFVFRLAGRERQQSASYYTPEVLTKFTVGQALEELLDQDGRSTTAAEILDLTVCEPALGSGAFAIEAVRQLAEQYLTRRQDELGQRIDPDEYPRRLQEVKAYLALHNVYGVDLNATAVELAEISLWLDTMVEGLSAPWFGLHLRRGNSLIGARRAIYRRAEVSNKSWLTSVPLDVPMTSLVEELGPGEVAASVEGGIHHFLLPADGWGAAADAKESAALAPVAVKELKQWRSSVKVKPTKAQVTDLVELAHRVEVLWQFAYQRLSIAEQEIRRSIPVWEAGELPSGGAVQRDQIQEALADANGAYRRLRRVMDAWTSMWFWPLTETLTTVETKEGSTRVQPPSLAQWIAGLQGLLGRSPQLRRPSLRGNETLTLAMGWEDLGDAEDLELKASNAQSIERVLEAHPWLVACERISQQQGFFHWNLDFAPVFARGGFDLQVGNPPWVRPRSDVGALLAEGDPWWQLAVKPTQTQLAHKRAVTLELPGIFNLVVDGTTDVAAIAACLGSLAQYPHLQGLQPDLYRCFMEQTWRHGSPHGTVGLIHPESHFTDEKAALLREETYLRLGRHWHFLNERILFEIDDKASFGVHVYRPPRKAPEFLSAAYLYHPDVVDRSRDHDGSGPEPGLKDPDGNWDLRPHGGRIISVTDETLATWHAVLEAADVPVRRTRMLYTVNRSVAAALDKIAHSPRMSGLGLQFSSGWHEKSDRTKGYFESEWGAPKSWDDVILQGPHLFVATPLYKMPNKTLLHNQDWSATDFETLASDAVPVTAYKPTGDRHTYDSAYTHWSAKDGSQPARDYFRLAWRAMAANTGERTLIPAIIPPGTAHINGVFCIATSQEDPGLFLDVAAHASSLLLDFAVRVAPKSGIYQGVFARLPILRDHPLSPEVRLRVLRLNCVVDAYAQLWEAAWKSQYKSDAWVSPTDGLLSVELGAIGATWDTGTPLRLAINRRQAFIEIDALVAVMLGLTADELCTVYRTQFAVLYGYDHNVYYYDANGRLVPNRVLTVWRKKREKISAEERTAINPAGNLYEYQLPFLTLDREADMRSAHAEFERRLSERS